MFLLSSIDRGTGSAGSRQALPNVCVCGMGKGVGVHQARIDTLRASCDFEMTGTTSRKHCQAVVADQGSVESQQCAADHAQAPLDHQLNPDMMLSAVGYT